MKFRYKKFHEGVLRPIIPIVSGITGEESFYYLHPITIKVGGWPLKINAGFMNISHMGHGVVGQRGFFDSFIVKFDLLKEEVELKERKWRIVR